MENLDVAVLRTLRDWRAAGRRALLATVVRTWGSSPRPVGSIMALADEGAVVGSVSGGCIEDDLIARYSHAHANNGEGEEVPLRAPPKLVKYGITADEAHRFGLPCGGTLDLLLEYDPDAALLADLVAELEQGKLMQRTVALATGAVRLNDQTGRAERVGGVKFTIKDGIVYDAKKLAADVAGMVEAATKKPATTTANPRQ